jgi:tRNA nucleotidyltransferase (CCA-adding enzyme)
MKTIKKYLVGGAVRDIIMGQEITDYDYTTPCTKEEIIDYAKSNNLEYFIVNDKYNTVSVKEENIWKEITPFRKDINQNGRHTDQIYTTDIKEDLARRDFTINAIAYDEENCLYIDPFDGILDIKKGVIRAVGDPIQRFKEDYLRIIRAARFAITFNFVIEENTYNAMRDMAANMSNYISIERVVNEVEKLFDKADNPSGFFNILDDILMLHVYFPLLYKIKNMKTIYQNPYYHPELTVWDHISNCLDYSPKNQKMRWAVLTHDLGKIFYDKFEGKDHYSFHGHQNHEELVDEFFFNLKVSNNLIDFCKLIMRYHMKMDKTITKKTIKKIINFHGKEFFKDLIDFSKIDAYASPVLHEIDIAEDLYNKILNEKEPIKPIVDGRFIMDKTGLVGKDIGALKNRCYEYQLESGETDKDKILEKCLW